MKLVAGILAVAFILPFVVGCSSGGADAPTAEDKAFDDSLAKAAKDSKGAPKASARGALPPMVSKGPEAAAAAAKDAGKDPAKPDAGAGK